MLGDTRRECTITDHNNNNNNNMRCQPHHFYSQRCALLLGRNYRASLKTERLLCACARSALTIQSSVGSKFNVTPVKYCRASVSVEVESGNHVAVQKAIYSVRQRDGGERSAVCLRKRSRQDANTSASIKKKKFVGLGRAPWKWANLCESADAGTHIYKRCVSLQIAVGLQD